MIHLVLVIAGGSHFYWSFNDNQLLPDWGLPGHPGAGLVHYPTDATRDVLPIPVHSHSDYWRSRPLCDALSWGCMSVEADVWHFPGDSELYVGHKTRSLTKDRTFRRMYVDPIVELLDVMNEAAGVGDAGDYNTTRRGVFDRDPAQTLVLMVDLKTAGADTVDAVSTELAALRSKEYLSHWDGSQLQIRAVTVVASGNTPFDQIIAAGQHRDIFIDAPLEDLSTKSYNASNSYYASVSFKKAVGHVWNGQLSSEQMRTIQNQISEAHQRGLKARYWDTPAWPINLRNHVWDVLMSAGADVLNADDLKAAALSDWKRRVHGLWY